MRNAQDCRRFPYPTHFIGGLIDVYSLFISHDLAVVRLISDYVCVMKDGEVVEAASSEEVFTNPRHPYTRRLLASIPGNELGIAVEADGTHV